MKKENWVRGMVAVISFAMGIGIFNASLGSSEDRLTIKDGSGNTVIVMNDTGGIGLGTTPQARIDSWSSMPGRVDFGFGGIGGGNLEAYSKSYAGREGQFKFIYGGGDFGSVVYTHYNGTNWADMMILDKDGQLVMFGGAYTNGYQWIDASSRAYKENIRDLDVDEAMKTLEELNPIKFNYKANSKETHVGFIAEDVPAMVATQDRKGMSPMDVVAVLTKVVQEQQKTIAELSERLKEIEGNLRQEGAPTSASNELGK